MNKNLMFYFILCFFLISPALSMAKETPEPMIRNPFIPQLPVEKVEQPKEKEQEPLVQKPAAENHIEKPVLPSARNILEERRAQELRAIEEQRQRQAATEQEKKKTETIVEEKAPSITITGLVWNSDRPQAIINGKVLSLGDTFMDTQSNEEIKINKIYKTGIDVSYRGKTWTITP
jgi:hypothetical protein